LIETGTVFVTSENIDFAKLDEDSINELSILAVMPRYSFFGDYQIFLNTASNVYFIANPKETVVCYTVNKDLFLELWNEFEGHLRFYMELSIAIRSLFQR